MRKAFRCLAVLLVLQFVGFQTPLAATAFEGKLRMRMATADESALAAIAGAEAGTLSPEKVFAITPEQLTAKSTQGVDVAEMVISVKGARIRVDHPGQPHYVIVDSAENVMYIVNPAERSYFRQTEENIEQMADQAAKMMAQMQEHLADMPPEQRKMMEQAMRRAGGGMGQMPGAAPAPPATVRPTGNTRQINGMNASEYEVHAGGLTGRAWMTKERPDIDRAFKQLSQLSKPMEKLAGTEQVSAQLADKGTPLLVQILQGEMYSTNELLEIKEGPIDPSFVQIPAGYTLSEPPVAP